MEEKRILLQIEERGNNLYFVTNNIDSNDVLRLATYLEIISESFKQRIINNTEEFDIGNN